MIVPLILPHIDLKSLLSTVEKELAINPFSGTDKRGYKLEDYRVWLNALRLKENYDLADENVQELFFLGYLIVADKKYLTSIGCMVQCNILEGLGIFMGSLRSWRSCLIRLLSEDSDEELRSELFQIYNHLNYLKFGYLFDGYKIRGTILVKV